MNIFKYKTAEYSGALPLLIGAILGGMKDESRLERLKEYGISLGWAFQIKDDLLGLYGHKEKTGKSISSDLKGRKITRKEFGFEVINKFLGQLIDYKVVRPAHFEGKSLVAMVVGDKKSGKRENEAEVIYTTPVPKV